MTGFETAASDSNVMLVVVLLEESQRESRGGVTDRQAQEELLNTQMRCRIPASQLWYIGAGANQPNLRRLAGCLLGVCSSTAAAGAMAAR